MAATVNASTQLNPPPKWGLAEYKVLRRTFRYKYFEVFMKGSGKHLAICTKWELF